MLAAKIVHILGYEHMLARIHSHAHTYTRMQNTLGDEHALRESARETESDRETAFALGRNCMTFAAANQTATCP